MYIYICIYIYIYIYIQIVQKSPETQINDVIEIPTQ